jgi:predicted transcriptional regulator
MLDQSSSLESEAHVRLDQAVLTLILDTGRPLSEAEIARAVDVPGHVPDSLKRLRRAGLIHRWNDLATPSRPAVRLHEIKQNNSESPTDDDRCESAVLTTLLRRATAGEAPLTDAQVHGALSARKGKQRVRISGALHRLDAAGLIERRGEQSIASEVARCLDHLMTP